MYDFNPSSPFRKPTLQGKVRYSSYSQKEQTKVCVLDLIFNFNKAYFILDEILLAGELQESSKKTVARLIAGQDALIEDCKGGG